MVARKPVTVMPPRHAPTAAEEEAQRYLRITAFTLLGVTLVRLFWLAGNPIDLYPDEAQYWLWSRNLAFGYYSKPPLIAWLIALTTSVFGEDEFGIRVASPLLHFLTGFVVYGIGKRLYGPRIGYWSAVVYVTLPAVFLSAAIISTDVPLLLCWAAALYAFIRAREEGASAEASRRWWIATGIAVGFGLLAKYAMAYWLISALILVTVVRDERHHLKPLLGATALGLVIYAPNFVWNALTGWASYKHTGANASLSGPLLHPGAFLEFFSAQFGVFGPLLFGTLLAIVVVFSRALADRRARLLAMFALPTLAMMLIVSVLSRAHANWSAPTYVSATVLVVAWLIETRRFALVAASVALHVLLVIGIVAAKPAATALDLRLPARYDLLHRVRGWRILGNAVGAMLLHRPGVTLLGDSREVLASLIYYIRPHPFDAAIWNPGGGARNMFELSTDLNQLVGHDFLFVREDEMPAWTAARFTSVSAPSHIVIPLGPGLERRYFVNDAIGFKGYQ
jgi:4-amino-4-deoxy-L-arabinose transferase-like glycosyltransferase